MDGDRVPKADQRRSDAHEVEMREESKFSLNHPFLRPGLSQFLLKKFTKGKKFDSGEYEVAKQTGKFMDFFPQSTSPEISTVQFIQQYKKPEPLPPSKLAGPSPQ